MRDKGTIKTLGSLERKKVHLDKLFQAINSCGVSLSAQEKRNADGKGSGFGNGQA